MAFLGRGRKPDLIKLAETLDLEVNARMTILEIKGVITSSDEYDEKYVETLFDTILREKEELALREREIEATERANEASERARQEELALREREIALREKTRQDEIALREKTRQDEIALREKEVQMQFEIERLRIEASSNSGDDASVSPSAGVNLRKLMPGFDPNQSDISLFLVIFERQAKRANIDRRYWVSHLLGLLPVEIVQLVAREPEPQSEDYDHVRQLLLQKFKLSPETFRQRFVQHQKRPDSTWKEFAFEIQNYLTEWIAGLEITSLEELQDLLVVDQIKKRAKPEMKEHFLDKWASITSSTEIVKMFDDYEDVRRDRPRGEPRDRDPHSTFPKERPVKTGNKPRPISPGARSENNREPDFEQRFRPRCFVCNSSSHLRPACPELRKRAETVSNIQTPEDSRALDLYRYQGKVNNFPIEILRDSGATIDLVCRKYVKPEDFCGEQVWIKQPLSLDLVRLPLASVEVSGDFGTIKTKAAVCGDYLNLNRYILGNRTAARIRGITDSGFPEIERFNAGLHKSRSIQVTDKNSAKREVKPKLELDSPPKERKYHVTLSSGRGENKTKRRRVEGNRFPHREKVYIPWGQSGSQKGFLEKTLSGESEEGRVKRNNSGRANGFSFHEWRNRRWESWIRDKARGFKE